MPTRYPLTISPIPELAGPVATEVTSGMYGGAGEVVRAGPRLPAEQRGPAAARRRSAGPARRHVGLLARRKAARHG